MPTGYSSSPQCEKYEKEKRCFFGVKNEMCIVKLPLLVFWLAMNFFNHEVVYTQSDDLSAEKNCYKTLVTTYPCDNMPPSPLLKIITDAALEFRFISSSVSFDQITLDSGIEK